MLTLTSRTTQIMAHKKSPATGRQPGFGRDRQGLFVANAVQHLLHLDLVGAYGADRDRF